MGRFGASGVEVVLDMDGTLQMPRCDVTGGRGKTTVSALVGHLLSVADVPAGMGAASATVFLGPPEPAALDAYRELRESEVAVLDAAWHPTFGRAGGEAQILTFDPRDRGAGDMTTVTGELRWLGRPLLRSAELQLLGAHNVANAMAAATAAIALGAAPEWVAAGLRDFEAVPHRLEPVGAHSGVLYVNDSKATDVPAAAAGIGSFPGGAHVILGGKERGERFEGLLEPLVERATAVYLIGETAERMEAELAPGLAEGGVAINVSVELDDAIHDAASAAIAGEVVLLSPAADASGEHLDFAIRGEHFRAIAGRLA